MMWVGLVLVPCTVVSACNFPPETSRHDDCDHAFYRRLPSPSAVGVASSAAMPPTRCQGDPRACPRPPTASNGTLRHAWSGMHWADERNEHPVLHEFALVPSQSVLFCIIQKTASSAIKGASIQKERETGWIPRASPPWGNHVAPSVFGFSAARLVREVFSNQSQWHRILVVRHPLERFVSAFNSKCRGGDGDGHLHCFPYFGRHATLAEAARMLVDGPPPHWKRWKDPKPNWHWAPQADRCGDLFHPVRTPQRRYLTC